MSTLVDNYAMKTKEEKFYFPVTKLEYIIFISLLKDFGKGKTLEDIIAHAEEIGRVVIDGFKRRKILYAKEGKARVGYSIIKVSYDLLEKLNSMVKLPYAHLERAGPHYWKLKIPILKIRNNNPEVNNALEEYASLLLSKSNIPYETIQVITCLAYSHLYGYME